MNSWPAARLQSPKGEAQVREMIIRSAEAARLRRRHDHVVGRPDFGQVGPAQKPVALPERIKAPLTSASSSQRAMRAISTIAASEKRSMSDPARRR